MNEDISPRIDQIIENNDSLSTEIQALRTRLTDDRQKNKLDEMERFIFLMNERLSLIQQLMSEEDFKRRQGELAMIDKMTKEYIKNNEKSGIRLDRLNENVISMPVTLEGMSLTFGYKDADDLLQEIRKDPLDVINKALLQFSLEWQADEQRLRDLQSEGRIGEDAQRISFLIESVEAKVPKSRRTEALQNLLNAKNDIKIFTVTILRQQVKAINTFVLIVFIAKNLDNEIRQADEKLKEQRSTIDANEERIKEQDTSHKRRMEEQEADYNDRRKQIENELERLRGEMEELEVKVEKKKDKKDEEELAEV